MNFSRYHLFQIPDLSFFAVEDLDLSRNNIKSVNINKLPRGLKRLHLEHNNLTQDGMPSVLPDGLEELYLGNNEDLISLREIQVYPTSLKLLDLQETCMENMNDFHCNSLETLNLDRTHVRILQNLPRTLKHLKANRSSARLLPNRLPPTLETLEICRSWLKFGGLPRHWGNNLISLTLEGNFIEKFPIHLPSSLKQLNLAYNQLTEIPEELPEDLMVLNLIHNKIRKVSMVRRTKAIRIVYLQDNQLIESIQGCNQAIGGRWASMIEEGKNWNTPRHQSSVKRIQKVWRRFRMQNRLRTWRRKSIIQDELLMVAMMPERVWQTDTLSPEWKR